MALPKNFLLSSLFATAFLLATVSCAGTLNCFYTITVKTGDFEGAGTSSNVSLTIYDDFGNSLEIPNIVEWGGAMLPGHEYFKDGNLDFFIGSGACLSCPPCAILLSIDGTGDNPYWYVDYINVTSCHAQMYFEIQQWLTPSSPTVSRNNCPVALSSISK